MKFIVVSVVINFLFFNWAIAADIEDLEKGMRKAATAGNHIEVGERLKNLNYDPAKDDNKVLHIAASRKDPSMIRLVLKDKRFKPLPSDEKALFSAAKLGRVGVMLELLNDKDRFDAKVREKAFKIAVSHNQLLIVKHMLLQETISIGLRKNLLYWARMKGFLEVAALLSENGEIDVNNLEKGMNLAAAAGNIIEVRERLKNSKYNPSKDANEALYIALRREDVKMIKLFLKDKRFKPLPKDREALISAVSAGRFFVVTELLKDKHRFDLSIRKEVLELAVKHEHMSIIRYMLLDNTIDINTRLYVLSLAKKEGLLKATELLRDDINVDSKDLEKGMCKAASAGNFIEVKERLTNPNYDPSKDANAALPMAACHDNPKTIKMMLKDKRFKPLPSDKKALILAAQRGHFLVVVELLKDKDRFEDKARKEVFTIAVERLDLPIFKHMLLDEAIDIDARKHALSLAKKKGFLEAVKLLREEVGLKVEDELEVEVEDLEKGMRKAATIGNCAQVRERLKNPNYDPAKDDNAALVIAALSKNPSMVKMMLKDIRFKSLPSDKKALTSAAHNGHFGVVAALLKSKNRFDDDARDEAFLIAAEKGRLRIIQCMLAKVAISLDAKKHALDLAIKNNFPEVVQCLLRHRDPAIKLDPFLSEASRLGFYSMVELLLEAMNSEANDHRYVAIYNAIQAAVKNGQEKIVDLLLNAAPIKRDVIELAILNAQKKYYNELAHSLSKTLATLPLVDADISAVKSKDNGSEVLEELFKDAKTLEPGTDNERFIIAAKDGNVEALRQLLEDYRLDPALNDNEAFRAAASNGHSEVVKVLLAQGRVNPTAVNNEALRFAARNGHAEVIRLLLEVSKIDAGANNNEAIRMAQQNGHSEIVELLKANPKVNPSVLDDVMID